MYVENVCTVQVLGSANPDFYPMSFSLCGTSERSVQVVHVHTRGCVLVCTHTKSYYTHTRVLRISRSRVFSEIYNPMGRAMDAESWQVIGCDLSGPLAVFVF